MRKVHRADCDRTSKGGVECSAGRLRTATSGTEIKVAGTGGGAIRELPEGINSCDTGAGLPGDSLQQGGLWGWVCTVVAGAASAVDIIAQPGGQQG